MKRAKVIHVKKARKSNKALGIKKGCEYWHWRFNYGSKQVSLTDPGSEYQVIYTEHEGNIRDFEIEKDVLEEKWQEDWDGQKEDLVGRIEEWRDELQSRLDNIPEQLQESHMINEQIEEVESILSDVESLDEPEKEEDEDENNED